MERKDFLKSGFGFLGMALVSPSILALDNNGSGACVKTRSETEGPFPTKNPAAFQIHDITDNRTGIPFIIELSFKNTLQNCAPAWGIVADIWHCDKDGYYSEYGGAGNPFQTKDMRNEHFLRGRQITNPDGVLSYKSIFPGWYDGRATHIHVHVYDHKGKSLLITQIAFPEGANSAVNQVNASTANGYTKGMNGYTYNAQDGEFKDGVSDEMSTITGTVATGYKLTHTIYVPVTVTTGVDEIDAETQFKLGQNYPNPVTDETTLPITLLRTSDVKIEIFDLQGKIVFETQKLSMNHGLQKVPVNLSSLGLANGRYVYSVEIRNENGTFKQSKMMVKQ